MLFSLLICSMSRSQMITVLAACLMVAAAILPWVYIQSPDLTLTGLDTGATRFGKPAAANLVLTALLLICAFIPRVWAKRLALLFAALNLGWAIRNFVIISRCEAGECPDKKTGLYLLLFAAIILLGTALFPKEPPMKQELPPLT
ncbi:hypothetical protein GCM10027051_15430 [Niabella terrae]